MTPTTQTPSRTAFLLLVALLCGPAAAGAQTSAPEVVSAEVSSLPPATPLLTSAAIDAATASAADTASDHDSGALRHRASGNILTDLVPSFRELRRVPSRESATLVGIGAAVAFFGSSFDTAVTTQLATPALAPTLAPGETLGGARFQMAGAAATYTIGRLTGSSRVAQVGGDLVRAQLLAQGMTAAIKLTARRGRPDGTQFSFPSGHSSVTFASATVLQRDLGWKVGVPAYAAAVYVAASRIHEKRHFLSDVAFGAAIGIVAGRSVTVGRGDARFSVAPVPTPGGGAVAFTWVGRQ